MAKRRIRTSYLRDMLASPPQNSAPDPGTTTPPPSAGDPGTVGSSEIGSDTIATAHIQDLAVDTAKIKNLAVTNAKINDIDAAKITAGLINTTRLNLWLIIVQGATWSNSTPSAGYVSWSGATVYYQGVGYTIGNDNTNGKYIWWDLATPTQFTASSTRPTLSDNAFLIATNDNGIHDIAWNSPANLAINPGHINFEAMASLFIYGDGIDGDVTISGNTTLTRDMSYNNLTINGGVVLSPAGYRIFVKNTLTNNGTIRANGPNCASNSTAAVGYSGAHFGSSGGGGVTNTGTGGSTTDGLGAAGGAGGDVPTSPWSPGVGGPTGTNTQVYANRHGMALLNPLFANVQGGRGGGGGKASRNGFGQNQGVGGAGGGVVIIAARVINNGSGTIEANGSAGTVGGNFDNVGGFYEADAGGGGGGGGAIVLIYRTITQGTLSVAGGAGGAHGTYGPSGSATNGLPGSTGLIHLIQQEA